MGLRYGNERRERRIGLELDTSTTATGTPDKFSDHWRARLWLFNFNHCHTFLAAVMNQDAPARCAQVLDPVCLLKSGDEPAMPLVPEDKDWCRAHDAAISTRNTQQVRSRNKAQADHSAKDGVHQALPAW